MRLFGLVVVVALLLAAPAEAQWVATLKRPAPVFRGPSIHGWTGRVLPLYTPLSHQRSSLPVVRRRRGWLRVLLPGRPNSHTGWIRDRAAALRVTPWRLLVRTASRRLFVLRGRHIVRSFAAVVGKPSTPTPHGRFYIEEALILPYHSPGWPYALALSARSTVFQEFDGGPGQIAIHGTYAIGGRPGTAASHGCVRLTATALRWIIRRLGTGTPVDIR
jgi:lipoprotein-anchoring transpeptidase ErfK/SrfK